MNQSQDTIGMIHIWLANIVSRDVVRDKYAAYIVIICYIRRRS